MRKALCMALVFGMTMAGFIFSCKTKSNNVSRRVMPTAGSARIPAEWDGLSDWSGNAYTLGEAP